MSESSTNNAADGTVADEELQGIIAGLEEEIQTLRPKCEEYLNGWKRALADYKNLEKTTGQARSEWFKYANTDLLMNILPIYDNFKLALTHVTQEQKKMDWVIGMEHIKNQFAKFLTDQGIEEIKTIGEKFNPEVHEALESINNKQKEGVDELEETLGTEANESEQIIKQEVRAGYKLHGRVLYAAKVIVE